MENITGKLDDINKTLKELTEAVRKPKENKLIRVMEFGVLIVSIFGIIQLIDIILKWIGG